MVNFGYSGDGNAATSAQLNFPYQITVDASDNVIFADYNNNVIRKVDISSGVITRLLEMEIIHSLEMMVLL